MTAQIDWRDRFWPKVDRRGPDECWPWLAYLNPDGYGHLMADRRPRKASRLSWELANGPVPVGLQVLHRCDNPACVNPAHLFLGTQADNMRDMHAKGRWQRRNRPDNGPTCRRGHDRATSMRPDRKRPTTAGYCGPCHSIREASRQRRLRAAA